MDDDNDKASSKLDPVLLLSDSDSESELIAPAYKNVNEKVRPFIIFSLKSFLSMNKKEFFSFYI